MQPSQIRSLIITLTLPTFILSCASLTQTKKGNKDTSLSEASKKNPAKEEYPVLKAPEASCTKVGEKIEGNRYIGSHIVCEIEKPAVWVR